MVVVVGGTVVMVVGGTVVVVGATMVGATVVGATVVVGKAVVDVVEGTVVFGFLACTVVGTVVLVVVLELPQAANARGKTTMTVIAVVADHATLRETHPGAVTQGTLATGKHGDEIPGGWLEIALGR